MAALWDPAGLPRPGPPPDVPPPEPDPDLGPGWPAWMAPVALLAGFAAALFGGILILGVGAAAGADVDDPPAAINIAGTLFLDLCLVGSALLFARLVTRPRAWQFGLRPAALWSSVGWVLLTWLGFLAFTAAWVAALDIEERDNLPEKLGADESTLALLLIAFLATVAAPIAEEFFFRGFFFTALRSWSGPGIAAVLTGLVFGLFHVASAPIGYIAPLAIFGFGLCLLYWRTGSLYPCISLHALNNSLAFGVTQDWDWQIPVVMLSASLLIAAIVLPFGRAAPRGRPGPVAP